MADLAVTVCGDTGTVSAGDLARLRSLAGRVSARLDARRRYRADRARFVRLCHSVDVADRAPLLDLLHALAVEGLLAPDVDEPVVTVEDLYLLQDPNLGDRAGVHRKLLGLLVAAGGVPVPA